MPNQYIGLARSKPTGGRSRASSFCWLGSNCAIQGASTPAAQDLRIENLNLRSDAVAEGAEQLFTVARLDASQAEGNSGTTAFTFTVARSGDVVAAAQLNWQVAGIGGPGTFAANAEDFAGNALPTGIVSFGAGQTSQTITVNVAGDSRAEANERFALALGDLPSGAAVISNGADGVILGDDTSFSIGEINPNQAEGTGSASTEFTFAIYRGGPAGTTQTVDWAVTGAGGAGALAASASDFDGGVLPTGSVTFGNDAFSFIGTAPFNGTPGQLRWSDQGPTRLIQGNATNDTTADFTIMVTTAGPVEASWFVL